MIQPPEPTEHITETQRIARDITTATTNLARDWPHMIRTGETQAPGMASRSGVLLDDHDPRDADQNRITKTLSLRRFAQDQLNAWCRVIIEDRGTTGGVPTGTDVPGMAGFIARHADWISGHETANDCRDELTTLARRCHLVAYPKRRDSISIGRCPLVIPGEQDVLETCGGDVRSRPTRLEQGVEDGQAWAACSRCGEVAVAAWWEDRMFDDPELRRWLTDADVVPFMHRTYGQVIDQATVRQWVKRKVLFPAERKTEEGKRLFDRDAVILAIEYHLRHRVG